MSAEHIRARLAAATPGPWFQGREGARYEDTRDVYTEREASTTSRDLGRIDEPADAEFIANAPTDIAKLLGVLDAVEALHDLAFHDKWARTHKDDQGHGGWCSNCGRFDGAGCQTIAAINGALTTDG